MKYTKFTILISLLLLIMSCEMTTIEDSTAVEIPSETIIVQQNDLFIEQTSDIYVFETNNLNYITNNGYTIWSIQDTNTTDSFQQLTVNVEKSSGRKEAGFGLVFCVQQIDNLPFMLTVLLNANGLYTIGKVVNGKFSYINNGWKNSNYIKKGYGIKNEINISYDEENSVFILKINGYEITNFTVPENIKFKNCNSGFVSVIANNEEFPNIPVKVIYEK